MKIIKRVTVAVLALVFALIIIYVAKVNLTEPQQEDYRREANTVSRVDSITYLTGTGSWLRKNKYGLWEMIVEGSPMELGGSFGALASESGLIGEKEAAFVGEIKSRIPSDNYLSFLKYMVGWFNRDLDDYVPIPYLKEIYASAQYMSDDFDYIAPKYHRALSYHAAHDIGHAMQNLNLVGCTSFATWDDRSAQQELLIGRNFDFYFGQPFARDKIIAFYKPDSGYQFMSVTWACFSGVVSGMNEKGLTVTLNAAKSAIPTKGKSPVSLIARDILQHAGNIDEAVAIASKYESFVAETFLIGSKEDGKVGLIEKTPSASALFTANDHEMIITNHLQSETLKNDPENIEYEAEEVSGYRYDRVDELIDSLAPLTVEKTAWILRDVKGLQGKDIGLSNEKAINQLIAHHSVIFSPGTMKAWVSAPPFVLGEYVAYDLDYIFNRQTPPGQLSVDSLTIEKDPFVNSEEFKRYQQFMDTKEKIQAYLYGSGAPLAPNVIEHFAALNPKSFLTYYYLGDYYFAEKNYQAAAAAYTEGLNKEIAKVSERKHMEERLVKAREALGN